MLSINQSTSLNNRATQRATKNFLMSYRHWQFQLNQAILLLQQPQLDNRQMIQKRYQRALEECHLRKQSLQMLGKLGTQEAFAADLLTARFLKRWSIAKTCQFLTQKYHLTYLAERTFNRDQNRALRLSSQLCP